MKVEVVIDCGKAYCDTEIATAVFNELNYCNVEKLDEKRIKLVFDNKQLERFYIDEEFSASIERFIRETLSKLTEATEISAIDDFVEDVKIEFSDDEVKKIIDAINEFKRDQSLSRTVASIFEICREEDSVAIRIVSDNAMIYDTFFVDKIILALKEELSKRNINVEITDFKDSAEYLIISL